MAWDLLNEIAENAMKSTITTLTLASLLGACSNPETPVPLDMKTDEAPAPADLAVPPPPDVRATDDLRAPPDLVPPPKLADLPACAPATVTSATLYTEVAKLRCTARYCHGTTDPVANFSFDSAVEMRAAWVGSRANQSPLAFVSAGNLDLSYVMWKLVGQQGMVARAGMEGERMPQPPREPLSTAELCMFVNWIRNGAP